MILEAYRAYARKHNYEYVDPEDGTVVPMIRLNQAKFFKYHFSYIRGLQDFVVTGVKHNDNGSKDFESLFLRNMADESNSKKVREILQGPLELDAKSASDIIRIVTWAEMSGMRLACSGFLKLYNKGTMPYGEKAQEALERLESFVQENTYFGKLLKPIYDVIYEFRHSQEIAEQQADDQMVDLLADLGIQL